MLGDSKEGLEAYEQLATQRLFFDAQGFCEELFGVGVQCASKPTHVRVGLRREAPAVAHFPELEQRMFQEGKCAGLPLHIGE